jgi:Domain of unknown function (DUF4157)
MVGAERMHRFDGERESSDTRADEKVVRRRLTVGAADDALESEADQWAAGVMSALTALDAAAPAWTSASPGGRISRRAVGPGGGPVDVATEREITSARAGGRPLDDLLRPRMEQAFGADFGDVRVHVDAQSDRLNERIQARAFTTGSDIFVRRRDYAPHTARGQGLLAHELAHTLQQRGGTRVVRSTATSVIRRYTDIPSPAQWKADSSVARSPRSKEVQQIGEALAAFDLVRASTDLRQKRQAIKLVIDRIERWELEKRDEGVRASARKDPIANLKAILQTKLRENLDAHATQLAPLAARYTAAATAKNFARTRKLAAQLDAEHYEMLPTTATSVLANTNDNKVKATVLFTPPSGLVGTAPFTPMAIKAIASWNWLKRGMADEIIEGFVVPFAKTDPNQIIAMFGHRPWREALLTKASPWLARRLLADMPALRIAKKAEADAAANATGPVPTVVEIADACFAAFLGDAPVSGLGYVTNAIEFEPNRFLLGDSSQGRRASCMVLSLMLNAVLKMVLPPNDPAAAVNNIKDGNPMLTKKLATIGTGNGILTRDSSFRGNVDQYQNEYSFKKVNRIFFGDGHEWLMVGAKEYDPTLGISGPVGTVAGALEPLTWTQTRPDTYTTPGNGGMTAVRTKREPLGGRALMFERAVSIQ